MLSLTWIKGLLARRRGRLAASAAGVAIAVALLASIGVFLAASKATMTSRALTDLPVDWQVQTQAGTDPNAVLSAVAGYGGVTVALPVGFAATTGLEATTGGSTQSTGPGIVLGLPDTYRSSFPGQLRDLAGAGAGALVAQQTAANLHVAPGDTVRVGRGGLTTVDVRIDGVVDLPAADSLFQHVGAGTAPQAPPDNVMLLPSSQWHEIFDPVAATHPDQVTTQIHARVAHDLAADPAAAYTEVTGRARNLEVALAGAGTVGDNLAARLGAARGDALYAQVLFLFLGLPGAVLAGLLTASVAGAGAERRRRDQALLRARGASTSQLVRLATAEALAVGVTGSALGLTAALGIGVAAFGSASFGATTVVAEVWSAAAAAAGIGIALLTVAVPAWHDARSGTVAAARRSIGRARSPRWARYGLDFLLLAGSGSVFWLTGRNGYKLVLAPEGVPTISVSYWAFAGPALLWAGSALLAWRLSDLFLSRGRGLLARGVRPLAGTLSGTVAASMSRQRRTLSRAVVLVALTVSFAASTAVFNSTYQQQAHVDALLSNGADVTVTESPGATTNAGTADQLAAVPGVKAVEPIEHRYAYVGADLQDIFGVRTSTIAGATKLQDAYFQGGSAKELMATLGAQPDSLIVSAETVKDFQLHPGDRLTLRLQDGRTKRYTNVAFHYVGVATEFPTAPKDSFLIANADYIASVTGSAAVGAYLIDTGSRAPAAIADVVRTVVGTQASVTDIETSRRVIGSSLTSVDLAGLTKVELGFALLLAAAATGLVLALGLAERRRTFAIAAALGARPRQLGGFVWAEAIFVAGGGLALGAVGGWVLAEMLVKVLSGVFDPRPDGLAVPWLYLGAVGAVALGAVALGACSGVRASRRPALSVIRDL
ncbi:MAG: FtsX-like permease family protein [Acidimicrobiales bacterium]